MALSVIYPRGTYFYAIGNTSAEILTEGLPPEDNADVLSLGCGDARNILYTVYADRWAGIRKSVWGLFTQMLRKKRDSQLLSPLLSIIWITSAPLSKR